MPKDLAASYCPLGKACNPPLMTSATYAASNNDMAIIHLTNLSIKKSAGKNIGNITADINKTVISGTPLQNSINPIEIYLIKGKLDLLPNANAIPIGKQNIRQKKDIIKVRDKPPHAPVSTQFNPSSLPSSIYSSKKRKYFNRIYKAKGTIKK